jgi:hypothetical protein
MRKFKKNWVVFIHSDFCKISGRLLLLGHSRASLAETTLKILEMRSDLKGCNI